MFMPVSIHRLLFNETKRVPILLNGSKQLNSVTRIVVRLGREQSSHAKEQSVLMFVSLISTNATDRTCP